MTRLEPKTMLIGFAALMVVAGGPYPHVAHLISMVFGFGVCWLSGGLKCRWWESELSKYAATVSWGVADWISMVFGCGRRNSQGMPGCRDENHA